MGYSYECNLLTIIKNSKIFKLPYGTLKDKEMKALRVDLFTDEGLCFLWVTGRAMELGRECLEIWGYKRVEEIIWVKTNQL